MRNAVVLLALLMSLTTLNAQTGGRPGGGGGGMSGRFYGKVVDASNKGVEAASVTLVQERMDTATKQRKENVVSGMLTTATGDFSLEGIPVGGRYKLRITGIGFKMVEQAVSFSLPPRNGNADPSAMMGALDKDLGNIKLEIDDKVLSNVTVSSTARPQMSIDRKIYNVENNTIAAGGSALDVMKNVPSVSVDLDGNVSLRNSAPTIFVDGRPTNLTLEQIPADAIESVEVITNPSAKFDASGGMAGILNIVLKKTRRVGYNGNIRANVDSRGRVGGGINGNVRQGKINAFLSANVNQRKSIGTGTTNRQFLRDTMQVYTNQYDRSVMEGMFGFGRAGFDYFIDNRNTLTIAGNLARGRMNPTTESDVFLDSAYRTLGTSRYFQDRLTESKNRFRNSGAQISFKHNFPKSGHEWTADITYNQGRNENNAFIRTDSFSMPSKTYYNTDRQRQIGSGRNENLVVQTDYVKPITDNSKIEAGFRTSIRTVNSVNTFDTILADGSVRTDEERNIRFNSRDQVYAAYATFSNRIKNFGYQLGLRAESSNYEGNLVNKGEN
ncbi:MAG TPA: TonB-dependent receptor, partial [Chitinophagaceae bacterium]|nr:TonB-dependent receptor [Chitinophagaceae bacterium]